MKPPIAHHASLLSLVLILCPNTAFAAEQGVNRIAVTMFLAFVAVTLAVTFWAARQTRTTKDFYAAGGRITGLSEWPCDCG